MIDRRVVLGSVLTILCGVAVIVSIVKYSGGNVTPCDLTFYGMVKSSERIILGTREVYSLKLDIYEGFTLKERGYAMVVGTEMYSKYKVADAIKNRTSVTIYKNCVAGSNEYSSGIDPPEKEYSLENFYKDSTGIRQAMIAYISMLFIFFASLTGLCILDNYTRRDMNRINMNFIDPMSSVTL